MTIFSEVMVSLVVRNEHVLGDTLGWPIQNSGGHGTKNNNFLVILRQICKTSETLMVVRTAYLADRRLKHPNFREIV